MHSRGPHYLDEQRQDDLLERAYSSSVPIQDVTQKTCRKQWTMEEGGEKGSGSFVLMARHDDDHENDIKGLFCEVLLRNFIQNWP